MTALGFTPPGAAQERIMPPQTPANVGGSFLLESSSDTNPIPRDLLTPVCELTGVPFVLAPTSDLPPIPAHNVKNIDRIADWHHPFHPRAELVNGTLGQKALRACRVQWAKYEKHHNNNPEGYHSIYYGPPLPLTEDEQFRTVIFAAAGYIPPQAIDFQLHTRALTRQLTDAERSQLWGSGQIRIDVPITVRDFIIDHALKREFIDVDDALVDEFLNTLNLARRQQVGNMLLRAASHEAVEPINPTYRQAKREGLIPPMRKHSAGECALRAMNLASGRGRAYRALERRLKPAA